VLSGGRRNPRYEGYFYEPTVLVDVDHSMDIMREETSGPTLPIQMVKDEDEALRLANDSSHRSQASLWTRDRYRARQLVARISAAGVTVNDVAASGAIPLGGFVQNGAGTTNGGISLKNYCDVQSVVLRRFRLGRGALSYPYTGDALRSRHRTLRLLYHSPIGKLLGN
jgi:acyl-CoA reductase-like NAD-dependent aldehyde dehydrogenase